MQLFSKNLNSYFALENIKKHPQKLLIISPKHFFSHYWPRIDFSYYEYISRLIYLLICGASQGCQRNQAFLIFNLFFTERSKRLRIKSMGKSHKHSTKEIYCHGQSSSGKQQFYLAYLSFFGKNNLILLPITIF